MSAPEVTTDRIAAWFDAHQLNYERDGDRIAAMFADLLFVAFEPSLPVLACDGAWVPLIEADDDIERAVALAHRFNSENRQPRAVVEGSDEGGARVMFTTTMPAGTGMTDEQLTNAIELTITLMQEAATEFQAEFPHIGEEH